MAAKNRRKFSSIITRGNLKQLISTGRQRLKEYEQTKMYPFLRVPTFVHARRAISSLEAPSYVFKGNRSEISSQDITFEIRAAHYRPLSFKLKTVQKKSLEKVGFQRTTIFPHHDKSCIDSRERTKLLSESYLFTTVFNNTMCAYH